LNGLTTVTTNGTADFVPIYSVTGAAPKKITLNNLTSGTARALATATTPLVVSSAVRPTNINQVLAFNGTQGSWVVPNHNALTNYVSNQHIDHSTVSLVTNGTSGISGGGDITVSRTLALNLNGLTTVTTNGTADFVPIYSVTGAAPKKITLNNLTEASPYIGTINLQPVALTTNTTTVADMTGVTLTTSSTKSFRYVVIFNGVISTGTNNRSVNVNINVAGSDVALKTNVNLTPSGTPLSVNVSYVTPTALASGTIIKMRWALGAAGAATLTCLQANMTVIGIQ
jgi:hypothetical protein